MPTLAIVGAGSGMGLAIARTKEKLDALVDQLGQEGIKAAAFPADVLDRSSLTDALGAAKDRFGGIDVLEYSPAPHSPVPGFALASPSEVTVDNLQPQVEYNFYGAVTAAQAVLPAMRKAGAGTLRNWVINLNKELTGSGVCAGHVVINVWIGDGAVERTDAPEDVPTATPDQIAPLYWDLHENRNHPEAIFST